MGLFDRFLSKTAASHSTPSESETEAPDLRDLVRAYHRATKHHVGQYARGPQDLNWATQPDPFRRYAGSELIELSHPARPVSPKFDQLAGEGECSPQPMNGDTISQLFRYALGLSAWKVYGESRWALRINPSSGNLHPTEGHLICGPIEGLCEAGLVAHYAPAAHALEVRARFDRERWEALTGSLPEGCALLGLSSILWREEWKYGERAYRYCQHDVGHAISALAYSASCLGWSVRLLDQLASEEVAQALGLGGGDPDEPEEADCLLVLVPGAAGESSLPIDASILEGFRDLDWQGEPNVLSDDHLTWDAIHACALAATKPSTPPFERVARKTTETPSTGDQDGITLLSQRRSAVSMDGRSSMGADAFFALLEKCMPRVGRVPFQSLSWRPRVHFLMFVHRVEGVESGAYALLRDEVGGEGMRACLSPEFEWTKPRGCPEELPLYLLKARDLASLASSVSCGQAIAGAGAFSLGMVAEFDGSIEEHGAWFYPRLFWETGVIGQTLYLEGEAAGLRGTGIGCFFDDAVHQVFGMTDSRFQSLYHFTIGGAVEDTRLQSEPPYSTKSSGTTT